MNEAAAPGVPSVRNRLGAELRDAMKRRDRIAMAVLRSALAAIDNAEAPPGGDVASSMVVSEHVAASAEGLGAAEVARLVLTERDMLGIVAGEARDREHAAIEYDDLGQRERAERLRAEAAVLRSIVDAD
jgi:uncharacterized protein YqeY